MKAEITAYGVSQGTVLINGDDVSAGVSLFNIAGGANQAPVLHLKLAVHENVHFVGDVEVTIPDSVRKILLHMGWTPPEAGAA